MRLKHVLILALSMMVVAGCAAGITAAGKPSWWKDSEVTSDKIATAALSAVPYPLADVQAGGFLERKNISERLVRFSKANKVGYLYLMSFGKFVGYYVVKGKISSVNSQLTNEEQTWEASRDNDTVVGSIGDDGSFGPNEGGDRGVFFFTSNDVMVETTLDWVYSDQILSIDVPNLLK